MKQEQSVIIEYNSYEHQEIHNILPRTWNLELSSCICYKLLQTVTVTDLSSFSIFKNKALEFLLK